jgi:hypothetical protein
MVALLASVAPSICGAQATGSLPPEFVKSNALATFGFVTAAMTADAEPYLNRVMPSGRRTFFVRIASAPVVEMAIASGVPALTSAGLSRAFVFDLDGERAIVFQGRRYQPRESLDVWSGTATFHQGREAMRPMGPSGPAVLVAKNGQIKSGSAYMGGAGPFAIIGMSENLLAVREVDPSRYLQEARPIEIAGGGTIQKVPKGTTGKSELRIAIYFTGDAEKQVRRFPANGQTIRSVIGVEVETLKRSFDDAGIYVDVKILPSEDGAPTSYAEKASVQRDVECLVKRESECAPMFKHPVHATILVRNMHGGCGMAGHGGGHWRDPLRAVAVVGWNCISNMQHGLVHELGHILGAQHENDADNGTFEFAKAYVRPDGKRGTLVSEMRRDMSRIPAWSTPKLSKWPGYAIGNDKQDNARALSETIPQIIKGFEQ